MHYFVKLQNICRNNYNTIHFKPLDVFLAMSLPYSFLDYPSTDRDIPLGSIRILCTQKLNFLISPLLNVLLTFCGSLPRV